MTENKGEENGHRETNCSCGSSLGVRGSNLD